MTAADTLSDLGAVLVAVASVVGALLVADSALLAWRDGWDSLKAEWLEERIGERLEREYSMGKRERMTGAELRERVAERRR